MISPEIAGTEVRIIGLPSIAAGRGGFQVDRKTGFDQRSILIWFWATPMN